MACRHQARSSCSLITPTIFQLRNLLFEGGGVKGIAYANALGKLGSKKSCPISSAPQDFGGHKHKAIEALGLAANELEQAIQFDKK